MALLVLILQIILLFCQIKAESSGLGYCANECGNVSIIYPFGIGDQSCYLDKSFEVICDHSSSSGSPQAYLPSTKNLELLNVSSSDGTIRVNLPVISLEKPTKAIDLLDSPFMFSQIPNRFAAIGCNEYGTIYPYNNSTRLRRCLSICTCDPKNTSACFDFLCDLPVIEKLFNATAVPYYSQIISKTCRSVSIVAEDWIGSEYMTNPGVLIDRQEDHMPALLDWGKVKGNCYVDLTTTSNPKPRFCNKNGDCSVALTSSYICRCNIKYDRRELCSGTLICTGNSDCSVCPDGYEYRVNGSMCDQTIYYLNRKSRVRYVVIGCSCGVGLLLLLAGVWWSYKFMKRRREIRLKQKFFKRNGGFLLQQELSSDEGSIEKTKLFTSQDLEKATDNYNANRILGQGGQGTVYKGMLTDGRIVAVKKSKLVDESNLQHFINELAILSQINHRNIVQLLGCCLETEVPMLVYEFIPNGTLNQYLHDQGQEFLMTWEMLLRIAVEVSGALFYLHSAASIPIYHRDIKSANILLDEKYHAKVSDFGTSRFITADQTHLTTKVQGTFGYLDPEFFQSSQYTEKSDVYSFGVVLVEILTRQKPFLEINSVGGGSLVGYFLQAMNENRLYEVIDARVLKEAEKEEIMTVATLARRCLNLNGKMRPTMKDVAFELGMIRASIGAPILHQNWEEIDFAGGDFAGCGFETVSSSTGNFSTAAVSVDADPLLSNQCR